MSKKHNSVVSYFSLNYPKLLQYLDNPEGYWPSIKDNTIKTKRLAHIVQTYVIMPAYKFSPLEEVCKALLVGRILGHIVDPDVVAAKTRHKKCI